ncbi:MAG: ASKHA domain-containing protein [Candidatus Sumerlaeota bacterium]|nr:ASKHA domain-containing protein [Candidatus Sumerlaeota bacterium]
MSSHSHQIIFQPDGKRETVMAGTTLLEAASRAGIVLEAPCGGNGICGKCRIQIHGDAAAPSEKEKEIFSGVELAAGWRLACQQTIDAPATVSVPSGSRLYEQKILMDGIQRHVPLEPNIRKTFAQLDKPTVSDQRADLDRLSDALNHGGRRLRPNLDLARRLPEKLRRNDFKVTLVTEGGELIAVESGDTTDKNYGVAVDLGTTTVVGMLVDLNTGQQLAVSARGNPQTVHGDDVISRIQRCMEDEAGAGRLHQLAVGCINEIIKDLCHQAGVAHKFIYELCVAGNTTMTHLLLNIPTLSLGAAPYVAAIRQSFSVKAEPMGFLTNHHARLYTLPNIAGFVGGDTTGVILSSGMNEAEELTLGVDIGTNGEIVMGTRKRLVACSTAAGPAFEGARIVHGMRAATGAIDKTRIGDEVEINVLGGGKARGICGTGLIDAVAQLLQIGVIDMGGRISAPDDLPPSVGDEARRRLIQGKGGWQFALALPEESETGHGVYLTQSDVRELQLAKAAIASGIVLLTKELGVRIADIQRVLLAGAFGNYINPRSAKIIGLIPDLPLQRLRFIGNAAGAGARMTLVSASYREMACRISLETEYIEMASRSDFQDEFMMQMMFPSCGSD